MRILQEAQALTLRLLAGREAQTEPFVFSVYCLTEPVPGGRLLYHTLTKELLFLEDGEEQADYLRRRFFLIEEGTDERAAARDLRGTLQFLGRSRLQGYTRYTILPTTDCNARCFYCYEAGCEKLNMAAAAADRTARFILDTCAPGELTLRFFGGEPLMGAASLDRICEALAENGKTYHSNIVTNGYLFTPERIRKAAALWHLKRAQITLDGTEEVYNARKDFVEDHDGAFRRVLDNIEGLLQAGIAVTVRLNMDEVNLPDLRILAGQLARRFGGYANFTVYPFLLFQDILSPSREKVERLFGLYREFRAELTDAGLLKPGKLPETLRLNHCMADDPASAVILPDGRLHACEHFTEGLFCGTVDEPVPKSATEAYWTEEFPEDGACAACPLYPDCFRMKNCPDRADRCIPQQREAEIEKLRIRMRAAYDRAVNGRPVDDNAANDSAANDLIAAAPDRKEPDTP